MTNPTRDFPDKEIEHSLKFYGGWTGWIGEFAGDAIRALAWKASQGDAFPEELHRLRDAIGQFGRMPIEEAHDRVNGLEKAFAEIAELLAGGGYSEHVHPRILRIVESCIKYSGAFGVAEPEPGDLIAAVNKLREVVGEPPIETTHQRPERRNYSRKIRRRGDRRRPGVDRRKATDAET